MGGRWKKFLKNLAFLFPSCVWAGVDFGDRRRSPSESYGNPEAESSAFSCAIEVFIESGSRSRGWAACLFVSEGCRPQMGFFPRLVDEKWFFKCSLSCASASSSNARELDEQGQAHPGIHKRRIWSMVHIVGVVIRTLLIHRFYPQMLQH
ncbi:hypothetical protein TNCV_542671 [Trichonephila clavipes]|nr:hypothetical protein TNCV_542671 [Trichonephila clavipes]